MSSITVHIADAGNALSGGGSSSVGHMWFTLTDAQGNEASYGFAPRDSGDPWGVGKIHTDDDKNYIDPPTNMTVEITEQQYADIERFAVNAMRDSNAGIGRWEEYNGLSNSCIDFTWQALNMGHLTDTPESGWQGAIWPTWNKFALEQMLLKKSIPDYIKDNFNAARAWFAKPDPLILDLNGNGIETVAASAATPILFDLNGDGIKTGTGWVAATDGFLVLDRNGNGTIDNGTELFGDSTQLAAGGKAADGFAALAGQDSNLDGAVNALDANFANLQVWQDLNQDGVSQAGELKTLTELGIASLNLAKTANSQTLTGGNQIADLGSFVRADGTTAVMADVNLASDAFHRSFTDVIASTTQTAALPDMQGAGMVRDLRQAASLQSVEGAVLASALGQYAASTTRNDQRARLDTLLADWAATSSFQSGIEKTAAQNELLLYLVPGLTRNDVIDNGLLLDMSVASGAAADTGSATSSIQLGILNPQIDLAHIAALKEKQQRITKLIGILEKFNGTTFVNIDATGVRTGANQLLTNVAITNSGSSSSSSSTSSTLISPYKAEFVLALSDAQISLIEQAYASLRQSVYDGLLTQTRLKPYLDDISLTLGSNGVALDFTALNARFAAAHAANDAVFKIRRAG